MWSHFPPEPVPLGDEPDGRPAPAPRPARPSRLLPVTQCLAEGGLLAVVAAAVQASSARCRSSVRWSSPSSPASGWAGPVARAGGRRHGRRSAYRSSRSSSVPLLAARARGPHRTRRGQPHGRPGGPSRRLGWCRGRLPRPCPRRAGDGRGGPGCGDALGSPIVAAAWLIGRLRRARPVRPCSTPSPRSPSSARSSSSEPACWPSAWLAWPRFAATGRVAPRGSDSPSSWRWDHGARDPGRARPRGASRDAPRRPPRSHSRDRGPVRPPAVSGRPVAALLIDLAQGILPAGFAGTIQMPTIEVGVRQPTSPLPGILFYVIVGTIILLELAAVALYLWSRWRERQEMAKLTAGVAEERRVIFDRPPRPKRQPRPAPAATRDRHDPVEAYLLALEALAADGRWAREPAETPRRHLDRVRDSAATASRPRPRLGRGLPAGPLRGPLAGRPRAPPGPVPPREIGGRAPPSSLI